VIGENLGCRSMLTDDEQPSQRQIGVGEHGHSVRAGAAPSVATGLPNAGGHMARVGMGRGGSGPPEEWAAVVGTGFGRPPQLRPPRRQVRGVLAAAEPVTTQ
jgi:hypothetical protein